VPRRPRHLARLLVVMIIAIGLTGCGDEITAKTNVSGHTQTRHYAPAYRVGQYCLSSKDAKYRAARLECKQHHLKR
jgi:uncharacterized lipoprotein YehR (DUF1307 family)